MNDVNPEIILFADYFSTAIGTKYASYEGYLYHIHYDKRRHRTFWDCCRDNCYGRLKSYHDSLILMKEHNHNPSPEEVEFKKSILTSPLSSTGQLLKNSKGNTLLFFNDYKYSLDRNYNGRSYWRCSNNRRTKCRGRIITKGVPPLVTKMTEHNHEGFVSKKRTSVVNTKNIIII